MATNNQYYFEKILESLRELRSFMAEEFKRARQNFDLKDERKVLICGYTEEEDCYCEATDSLHSGYRDENDDEADVLDCEGEESHENQMQNQLDNRLIVPEVGAREGFQIKIEGSNSPIHQVCEQWKVNSLPKNGFSSPSLANNTVIGAFSTNKKELPVASKVFDGKPKRDTLTWNVLIASYNQEEDCVCIIINQCQPKYNDSGGGTGIPRREGSHVTLTTFNQITPSKTPLLNHHTNVLYKRKEPYLEGNVCDRSLELIEEDFFEVTTVKVDINCIGSYKTIGRVVKGVGVEQNGYIIKLDPKLHDEHSSKGDLSMNGLNTSVENVFHGAAMGNSKQRLHLEDKFVVEGWGNGAGYELIQDTTSGELISNDGNKDSAIRKPQRLEKASKVFEAMKRYYWEPTLVRLLHYYTDRVYKIHGPTIVSSGLHEVQVLHEPISVARQVISWYFPWSFHEVCFPLVALYAVFSYGPITSVDLAYHMDVDKLVFTGSTNTGKVLLKLAAKSNPKPVTLELGGKSPFIVCDVI